VGACLSAIACVCLHTCAHVRVSLFLDGRAAATAQSNHPIPSASTGGRIISLRAVLVMCWHRN
jgi:hypothetical protein